MRLITQESPEADRRAQAIVDGLAAAAEAETDPLKKRDLTYRYELAAHQLQRERALMAQQRPYPTRPVDLPKPAETAVEWRTCSLQVETVIA